MSRRSCSGPPVRSSGSSSPSTTAARKRWPRTRSYERPTLGVGPSAAWIHGASVNRPLTRPAGCSPSASFWGRTSSAVRPVTSAGCIEALGAAGAFSGKPIGLYARGQDACLAATYAIARATGPRQVALRWYVFRDGFLSYRAFIDRPQSLPASYRLLTEDRERTTAFDREIPAQFFPFDALRSFDLPQLLAASPAEGLIVNPLDGDRVRLPEAVAQGAPRARPRRFGRAARCEGHGVPCGRPPAGTRGSATRTTRRRGPGDVDPPPRWSRLTAGWRARDGTGWNARARLTRAEAVSQPEGEPGLATSEDSRGLGAVPRTAAAGTARVALASARQAGGSAIARHAHARGRRLPHR